MSPGMFPDWVAAAKLSADDADVRRFLTQRRRGAKGNRWRRKVFSLFRITGVTKLASFRPSRAIFATPEHRSNEARFVQVNHCCARLKLLRRSCAKYSPGLDLTARARPTLGIVDQTKKYPAWVICPAGRGYSACKPRVFCIHYSYRRAKRPAPELGNGGHGATRPRSGRSL